MWVLNSQRSSGLCLQGARFRLPGGFKIQGDASISLSGSQRLGSSGKQAILNPRARVQRSNQEISEYDFHNPLSSFLKFRFLQTPHLHTEGSKTSLSDRGPVHIASSATKADTVNTIHTRHHDEQSLNLACGGKIYQVDSYYGPFVLSSTQEVIPSQRRHHGMPHAKGGAAVRLVLCGVLLGEKGRNMCPQTRELLTELCRLSREANMSRTARATEGVTSRGRHGVDSQQVNE